MKSNKNQSKSRKHSVTLKRKTAARLDHKSLISNDNFLQPLVAKIETYPEFLEAIKSKIRHSQISAGIAVNSQLVMLYLDIGAAIRVKQSVKGWGAGVINSLAMDLRRDFPGMTGFSPRNLGYMRAFESTYPDRSFVESTLSGLPWAHNLVIIEKVTEPAIRLWYTQQAIINGWSKTILLLQIESQVHQRHGKAVTNFKKNLPSPTSDLAQQLLKDPYCFDFLTLSREAVEQDLERGLLEHIRRFLLELGVGFAFIGNQYRIEVGEKEFFIDMLFYHLTLRCYVVIELKMTEFKPEYAGKLNFYLTAIDKQLKHESDKPTIGLILCKNKDKVVVEYALQDMTKPMGVSSFTAKLMESLPEKLKGQLPTVEQLEEELSGETSTGKNREPEENEK